MKGLQPCVVVFWNAKKWMTSKISAAKFSVSLLFTVMSCEKEVQRLHASFQNSPSSASRPKSSLRSPRNLGDRLVASLHTYPRMLLASYIFFPAFWWGTTAGRQITFPLERKYVRLGNRLSRTNQKRSRTYLMLTFNLLKLLCKSSATSATANKLGHLVQPKVEFRRTWANIDRT